MLNKSHLNAINSLQNKTIRQFVSTFDGLKTKFMVDSNDHHLDQLNDLNIHLRQSVIDYITEEKVMVSPQLIQSLVSGGLISLDLWRLCQTNSFTTTHIMKIMETIAQNSHCFDSLSLGGNEWIFNTRVIRGPLKKIFDSRLNQLTTLRMQQFSNGDDMLSALKSCVRLKRLEICLPCVTDRDIDRIEERLKNCESVPHIKELLLPSSFKSRALMKMLAIFCNTKTLKCTQFEQLMDLIEVSLKSNFKSVSELATKAKQTLNSLTSLTVVHPMSYNSIDRLVSLCPRLKSLGIELQKGMELSPINRLNDIRELQLRNSPSAPIQWGPQVLPILESRGKLLSALSLEHFDVIDLTTCAKLCPNLLHFSAQWFTILGYIRPNMPSSLRDRNLKPFSNVTHMRLRPLSGRNIPSDACAFSLSNAKQVTHIELYCCYDLSDRDVQALQTKNPMTHLRSLILRHGHKVTKEALNLLVSRADKLSYIDCGIPLKKEDLAPDP